MTRSRLALCCALSFTSRLIGRLLRRSEVIDPAAVAIESVNIVHDKIEIKTKSRIEGILELRTPIFTKWEKQTGALPLKEYNKAQKIAFGSSPFFMAGGKKGLQNFHTKLSE